MELRFETKVGCFVSKLNTLHIVICPHIFSTCNDTRFIVERSQDSYIQRYIWHEHEAHERIYLSIIFIKITVVLVQLLFHFLL